MYWLPYSSYTSHHPSRTPWLPFNIVCHWKTHARFMQDGRKAVWSIPYVSVASFFPSLKHNFIAYHSSSRPDCIFEIHQLWQSGFSRVYSNSCCSCWFEPEIIKIGQSSHKMYSNYIVNFKCLYKKVWKLIECTTNIFIDFLFLSSFLQNILSEILILQDSKEIITVEQVKMKYCKNNSTNKNINLFFVYIMLDIFVLL